MDQPARTLDRTMADADADDDDADGSTTVTVTDELRESFFRLVNRRFQTVNPHYTLPVEDSASAAYENLFQQIMGALLDGQPFFDPGPDALGPGGAAADLLAVAGASFLDVGCGLKGVFACDVAEANPLASVVGCDLVPPSLDYAPPNVSLEVVDVTEGLPYGDASFDVVHARLLSAWVPDYATLLAEVARVLKPGGLFFSTEGIGPIQTHTPENPLHQIALQREALYRRQGGNWETAYLIEELLRRQGSFSHVVGRVHEIPHGWRDDDSAEAMIRGAMGREITLLYWQMMSAQCLPSTVDRAALRKAEEDLLPARYDGLYRLEKFLVARKTVGGE